MSKRNSKLKRGIKQYTIKELRRRIYDINLLTMILNSLGVNIEFIGDQSEGNAPVRLSIKIRDIDNSTNNLSR